LNMQISKKSIIKGLNKFLLTIRGTTVELIHLLKITDSQPLYYYTREPSSWAQLLTALNRDRPPPVHVGSVGDGTDL
jgi:hypothetical protein